MQLAVVAVAAAVASLAAAVVDAVEIVVARTALYWHWNLH
jgi:hypothetical protein